MSDFTRTNDFNTGYGQGLNKDNILRSNDLRAGEQNLGLGTTGLGHTGFGQTTFDKGATLESGFRSNEQIIHEHAPQHLHKEHFPSDFRSNEFKGREFLHEKPLGNLGTRENVEVVVTGTIEEKPNNMLHAELHKKEFLGGEKIGDTVEIIE
jgi:hypothetical protein